MLEEGKPAPAFTLQAADGEQGLALAASRASTWSSTSIRRTTRPAARSKRRPSAGARAARQARRRGLGVSKDSTESHCKFRDKYGLKFPLLSDPDGKVIEKYGAWGEKNMYGKKSMGIVRTTVIVGPTARWRRSSPRCSVDGHVEAVLDAIKELRARTRVTTQARSAARNASTNSARCRRAAAIMPAGTRSWSYEFGGRAVQLFLGALADRALRPLRRTRLRSRLSDRLERARARARRWRATRSACWRAPCALPIDTRWFC